MASVAGQPVITLGQAQGLPGPSRPQGQDGLHRRAGKSPAHGGWEAGCVSQARQPALSCSNPVTPGSSSAQAES